MHYYIKLLGWKDHPMRFMDEWYQTMVTKRMVHATLTQEVTTAGEGDKFVLFCIANRFTDIVGGGFVGIDNVLGSFQRDPNPLYSKWCYFHDVSLDFVVPLDRLLPLKEVRGWSGKSPALAKALRENLRWRPLREITKTDYERFESELKRR